jgi:16S rRNA (guanine527-N7)-methyltransferase
LSNINSTTALATLIEREMKISGLQPGKYPATAFAAYLELLTQWNKAYNLTAIRDHKKMITHHILDSLSVLPYLNGEYCMDIGTGAGLPGLILALSTPERYWYLLDSNQKKIRFVNQAIMELNIHNIETICCRIEDFHSDKYFSTIISRAFGRLSKFYQLSRHLLSPNGKLLAMKGADISEELAEMGQGTINMQVHTLRVPGITGRRSLVEINVLPTVN